MRKLFFYLLIIVLFGCAGKSPDSPKAVLSAFVQAASKGDIDGMKKYISSRDVTMMEMGDNMIGAVLDSSAKRTLKEKTANDFRTKFEDASIDIANELIDNETAMVDLTATKSGFHQTTTFVLKKEDDQWKVSLMATSVKALEKMRLKTDTSLVAKGMPPGVRDSMIKMIEKVRNMNADSFKMLINPNTIKLNR